MRTAPASLDGASIAKDQLDGTEARIFQYQSQIFTIDVAASTWTGAAKVCFPGYASPSSALNLP